jgi:hypothetical protein
VVNTEVREECTVMHKMYIVLQDFQTGTLTFCLFWSQKYNLEWGLQQLREVWTKDIKITPDEEMTLKKMTLK